MVIAGAGSGKTALMSARVVWLVAHGEVTPDQVLGLTFTNKAAGELSARVRKDVEAGSAALAAGAPENEHRVVRNVRHTMGHGHSLQQR